MSFITPACLFWNSGVRESIRWFSAIQTKGAPGERPMAVWLWTDCNMAPAALAVLSGGFPVACP
ncbi:hypothetical protein [Paraburkholderia kururiensis]|uniref:hypothetical protein n=1 Tax=Paraburkholderia kururiensis TaxID=984307 RepID=UPI0012694487|nr:hypothetical protein [Paraburkholderia kururiensis]